MSVIARGACAARADMLWARRLGRLAISQSDLTNTPGIGVSFTSRGPAGHTANMLQYTHVCSLKRTIDTIGLLRVDMLSGSRPLT